MPEAEDSVTIDRPVDEVFAFLANCENDIKWRSGVIDIKRESGEGVGSRFRQVLKGPMGKKIDSSFELAALEPNRHLEFHAIEGDLKPKVYWDFEPAGESTRCNFRIVWTTEGMNRVAATFASKAIAGDTKALGKLKQVLEG